MDSAATAKQRHMARCEYRPMYDAKRDSRVVAKSGSNQTFKFKGDLVIDSLGKKTEVQENGWH